MTITREQGICAKSYFYRAAESAMCAYHADDKFGRDYWLRELEACFKGAAKELGYTVSKDAAVAEAAEAGSDGSTALPPSSSKDFAA